MKVKEKCPVKNKYIGEINGGDCVEDILDKKYNKQIIKIIKKMETVLWEQNTQLKIYLWVYFHK